MRLRGWLKKNERTDVADGHPVELATIDREAHVPPGSAANHLAKAFDKKWRFSNVSTSAVQLERLPERVRDVDNLDE
jgi:hypothetical protein